MDEPLEEAYFNWLCAKVIDVEFSTPSNSYDILLRTMHNTPFVWLLDRDDDRAMDGVALRNEFRIFWDAHVASEWLGQPCSFLEMLVALVDRCEFVSDIPGGAWFWQILSNLNFLDFPDDRADPEEIADILESINFRQYDHHGNGGLFPIANPTEDQRNVEIWYQFHTYLNDPAR